MFEHGTWLGLFIIKNIAEAHGDKMWTANNANGKGATFTLTLPVSLEQREKLPRDIVICQNENFR
jgi:signal transduction histidine kinase